MAKKLIEVALPLEAINKAAAKEKSIRHGHPSTLHLWWARRPLAAARAVLFAQLVDDPSTWPELQGDEDAQKRERQRLFQMIEDMVPWEATQDEQLFREVRREIARSHARFHRGVARSDRMLAKDVTPAEVNDYLATELPPVHDPFAGGGTIPLEAQRLGLRAIASDLNPVAVLINKALIEIPPKFAGKPPINPESSKVKKDWKGAEGLAEDVRYYGKWMREEAFKRIGHLYPKAQLPKEMGGGEATVIAWLWARTVKCSNPACGATMPLARSFVLSTKAGKEHWVEPVVNPADKSVRFEVHKGKSDKIGGTVDRRGARCVVCGGAVPLEHIREEGRAGRMGAQLMAIVAEGRRERIYLDPSSEHEVAAKTAVPTWIPETRLPEAALGLRVQNYGLFKHADLFTTRQLSLLSCTASLVTQFPGYTHENPQTRAIATYLSFAVSKLADNSSNLCTWQAYMDRLSHVFVRHALGMTWDYAETNPFADAAGDVYGTCHAIAEVLDKIHNNAPGKAFQKSARLGLHDHCTVSTDPPYYDNVPYADLSDFFYLWLRRCAETIFPDLLSTMLSPKQEELVADPFRHGSKDAARVFFEKGLADSFHMIQSGIEYSYPISVYYAFKQSESDGSTDQSDTVTDASTGWETMLEALITSSWCVNGTWPVRTELSNRVRGIDSNALASSIVLVCLKRPESAPTATRAEFQRALKRALPRDLKLLQQGNIAPVDFAQAAIGPGMAVYSSYAKVIESDGSPLKVRTALQLINQVLDEVLSEQEGDFDTDTRWALAWFEQHQYAEAEYGVAETLSKAKNTSVAGLVEAGLLTASRGKVRLRARKDLDAGWDPATDARRTVWEVCQHMIRALDAGGEREAAGILAKVGAQGEAARELAYRLYALCERKKWSQEALGYNALVTAWPELARLAGEQGARGAGDAGEAQRELELG